MDKESAQVRQELEFDTQRTMTGCVDTESMKTGCVDTERMKTGCVDIDDTEEVLIRHVCLY